MGLLGAKSWTVLYPDRLKESINEHKWNEDISGTTGGCFA